ncbi:sigma-54 dependent transcriptional regulator [Desulfosarcina sp. OttesenSCG-928-G10]|nr:sigma-54 dependent transcriptional regulator [Desulfosarcina sp. OttesenSCG-928-G10]MDL2321330.1 sigma-54 dependent transcriptional regulator [Desulfosarcina sp. OttesenSCG-928-B08]
MSQPPYRILVVDDELSMREILTILLEKQGYAVRSAVNGKDALKVIEKETYDLLLCDIRLGDLSGIDVLKASKQKHPHATVIMISAFSTTETAVEAMNLGAFDYVPKPFQNSELLQAIANALERKTLEHEKQILDHDLKENIHFGKIVGSSPRMLHIYEMIRQVAKTRTNVLITGESGTGKELIARSIHDQSDRADAPFVTINCGGIPENLLESEFFGHRKGAFTGATADKEGLMEVAHTGTLFLDEVAELTVPMQVKLLRAVQERVFRRVGGTRDISVDIRIVSATNKKLEDEVIAGNFREDLFYRLNVIELKLPPLRERKGDLVPLAQHFLEKYAKEMGKQVTKLSSYALDLLKKYDFPGNIRELENLIERSVALSNTNILLPDSLTMSVHKKRWIEGMGNRRFDLDEVARGVSLDTILEEIERAYVEKAMSCAEGNKNKAADLLGLTLRSFRYRLDKFQPPQ